MILWRTIPGFSAYQASSDGRIRRAKPDTRGRKIYIGRVLKPRLTCGYHRIWTTSDDGTRIYKSVHMLVALAFIGLRPHGYDTHHKDGDKLNNIAENLEYLKRRDHAALHPRKLSREDAQEILRLRKAGWFQKNIAKKFHVSRSLISYVCRVKSWLSSG